MGGLLGFFWIMTDHRLKMVPDSLVHVKSSLGSKKWLSFDFYLREKGKERSKSQMNVPYLWMAMPGLPSLGELVIGLCLVWVYTIR